jgi:hypothetical protein
MKKLMLLHNRYTHNDNDIWSIAIKNGWSTARTNQYQVKEHMEGYDFIRYYGNTMHAEQIKDQLPFKFLLINPYVLTRLSDITKRKISCFEYWSLKQPLEKKCFIKPVHEKFFEAKIYEIGENIFGAPLPNDFIYVSETINFIDEVRCFVLNGKVLTSSLYRINKESYQDVDMSPEQINFDDKIKDTPIEQYVKEICSEHDLPPGIVIDFGRLPNGEWALIEFNEAWASGLYFCDPQKCFEVIVASQENGQYPHIG